MILEAVAEIAPHVRRAEQVTEHVRMRIAQQICGDLADTAYAEGVAARQPLGSRLPSGLKRDAKGEIVEFDLDPAWSSNSERRLRRRFASGWTRGTPSFLSPTPEARPYVRMVVERLFATLPVLSHLEIAAGIEIKSLGTIS